MLDHDNPLFDALFVTACHMKGVMPLRYGYERRNVDGDMGGMSLEERRTAKRKFRKLWRKAAKTESTRTRTRSSLYHYVHIHLGLGAQEPTRKQKRARKVAVMGAIRREVGAAQAALMGDTQ